MQALGGRPDDRIILRPGLVRALAAV